MVLTLDEIARRRNVLINSKNIYEEENSIDEYNHYMKCLNKAEKLVKDGETVCGEELFKLA